jgi:mRNA interferase MazF
VLKGEIWWADVGEPTGSAPGFVRPVVIVSSDRFNRSVIATVVVAIMTSNMAAAAHPGNLAISKRASGLPRASVVNVSQLLTLDREQLTERVGRLDGPHMQKLADGLRLVLDL